MEAVILAAGQGTRLEQKRPKCLVKIGGKKLIDWQLEALAAKGVTDVVVVAGFKADRVAEALPSGVKVVVNDAYATTNSLASLVCAKDVVGRLDVIVCNADVFMHPRILRDLRVNSIAIDSSSKFDPEAMKVLTRSGELVGMSKGMPKKFMHGENLGVFQLHSSYIETAFDLAEKLVKKYPKAWVTSVLNTMAPKYHLQCVDTAGLPWIEIDYPSDLAYARRVILPAIEV